ncbi:serine/threonine-protein kinase [Streptomyces bluensis]|uniref:serine/threonine-protein kinase n=1 Tax=Streptomyces bluensis TaxID=33897 RepID=UPI0016797AF9|nr:serine/threonine-protein kinase [Streptomyces bluensis]GGZ83962.1 serine/threonine protein kinase [Streptomyces bluensis]
MGEVFAGRYELVDPIGRGGVGAVWRAWDHRRRRYVAAKVLQQRDAHSLLRFVREQALRIDHPHVLAPTSWAADDDQVLFTMELVTGGSLVNLVNDYGPLPPAFVCALLDQLLSGLAAVHAEDVVHRDIKPANVLLEATGTARPHLRLSDFGIAMRLGEPRLTETDYVVGTPGYFAPEQMLGAEPDFPADLFAVGLVALYLLEGAKPDAKAIVEYFTDRGTPGPPKGVPEPLWQVVATLLQPDPNARFRTATGARKALASATELLPEPGPDDELVEVFDQLGPLPAGFEPSGPLRRASGLDTGAGPATGTGTGTGTGTDSGTGTPSWPVAGSGSSNLFSPTPEPGAGADAPPSPPGPGGIPSGGSVVTPMPPPEPPPVTPGNDMGAAPPPPSPGSIPRRPSTPPPMPRSAPSPAGSGGEQWEYAAGTGSDGRPFGPGYPEYSESAPGAVQPGSAPAVPPRPERDPEPTQPFTMSDTGSFHLPPPQGQVSTVPAQTPTRDEEHQAPHHPNQQPEQPEQPPTPPSPTALPSQAPQGPFYAPHHSEPTHVLSPQPHPPLSHLAPENPSQAPTTAVQQHAYVSTGSYTARSPQVPRRSRRISRRRPGPPAKVAVPVLLLALACFAVGFWALAQL